MTITCDKCHGEYRALEANASAHVYVKDRRCNHIEAHCSHCGATEVIYLGPNRLQAVLEASKVPLTVHAEATSDLRLRAERAWAAAERRSEALDGERQASPVGPAHLEGGEGAATAGDTLTVYELTRRHEDLLASFGDALSNIPDDLLWDGFHSGERRKDLPDRWTD